LATFAAPITRLSDVSDPQILAQHRNEWSAKERQAVRDIRIQTWHALIVLILFTLFSLAWPWLLVALKSSLKRYLLNMSIAAIPGQTLVFWIIYNYRNNPWGFQTIEWPRLALFCESLIVLVVTLQFGFFIWQKLKPKSQKRIRASSS
jgi:cation transport ATPase